MSQETRSETGQPAVAPAAEVERVAEPCRLARCSSNDRTIVLPSDDANRLRWKGQADFQEAWYLQVSDPLTQTGFWIRYSLNSDRDGMLSATRLWFVDYVVDGQGGEVARYLDQPLMSKPVPGGSFSLELAGGRLTSSCAIGAMETPEGLVEWNLRFAATMEPKSLMPPVLQRVASVLGYGVTISSPAALCSGEITVGSRRFVLDRAPATQGHVWTARPWSRWTWFGCSSFEDAPDAYLEGLAFGFDAGWDKLEDGLCAAVLRWDGKVFRLDGLRSSLTSSARREADGLWLTLHHPELRLTGLIRSAPDDQVALPARPGSRPIWNHHSCVGSGTLTIQKRSRFERRWRPVAQLRAERTFCWGWGGSSQDYRVRRQVLPAT